MSIFFFFFIISLIPPTFSLSFKLNFTDGSAELNTDINCTEDAHISTDGIQLTKYESYSSGRAIYHEPLHLWDNVSNNLADFSTRFSFVIDSNGNESYADGMVFFLAPVGSIVSKDYGGGGLGLWNYSAVPPSSEIFVAVEFDAYGLNPWDNYMNYSHFGIDVNSMQSVTFAKWHANITGGSQNDVWINYTASSGNLTVMFTDDTGFEAQQGSNSISYLIDLRSYLPQYVIFGFSGTTGLWYEKNIVKSWEFYSTSPAVVPNGFEAPSPNSPRGMENMKENISNKGLQVGLSIGLSILILLLASTGYCLWRKYCIKPGDEYMEKEFEEGRGPREFSYRVLTCATNNFSESGKLGEGGFGAVYKGRLRETNSDIAVKRVSKGSQQGLKEYQSEVKIISQLKHRNLVQLLGWCHNKRGELLLVYEFMPHGSLDSHLFKGKSPLAWELRYKIAKGLASALLYLHEEGIQCVVHRDIKSSNIMLDSKFEAKLGDFGLARLVDHEKGSQTTILAGTLGYLAPECATTGKASKESDVYSFGVVLLEIACGRRTMDNSFPAEEAMLVKWVWDLYGTGRLIDAADPKLDTIFDEWQLERVLVVGLWCAHPDSNHRPSIRQAIQVLSFDAELPTLPCVMPVAMFGAPENSFSGSSISYYGAPAVNHPISSSSCAHSSHKTASSLASATTSS